MSDQVNILLVDDQPAKLLSYKLILEELGENLISAASPREAFDQLLRNEVAVILMDVQMPELDGFELAAMVRGHPRFEKTAIIFVSAIHLSDFDQLKGYRAGAVDYVSVPIVPELLRAKVRVFADLFRKTRALERVNEELERRVAERTAELEAAAARLRASEQRRSIALAAGCMGSWDWNADTGEHAWDEGQFQICGLDTSHRPSIRTAVQLLHPEDRKRVCEALMKALQAGETFRAEFRIRRPDGDVRWCVASGVPSRDEIGRARIMTGVTYDITERKLAERALACLNEELEHRIEERTREREAALAQLFEAQKMDTIGHLTGGVAHDFNNLLMAVLGSLELVHKRIADPRSLQLLDNAMEGARRGSALTKRLLAFARRQELKPVPIDVEVLVGGMKELLRRAIGPGVRLTTAIPNSLPAVRIDPNQLELALLNLAVNARDAMPDGGSLVISAEPFHAQGPSLQGLRPGDYICLSLADDGIGMDETTLAKATEPFFTTKGPGKGTGLGLSMVHGMAAQSGGALHLSSLPGDGTIVRLYLPVTDDRATNLNFSPQNEPMSLLRRNLPPLHILVVDDDSLVRAGTTAMLEDLGHAVIEAASGAEALLLLAQNGPVDLAIVDYAMPGMTGAEAIQYIRERFPDIPAILASGYAEAFCTDLKDAWVRLPKPFTQAEVAAAIAHAIGDKATEMLSSSPRLREIEAERHVAPKQH